MSVNDTIDEYRKELNRAEAGIEAAIRVIGPLSGSQALSEDRAALMQALDRVSETLHGLYRLYNNRNIKSDIDEKKIAAHKKFTVSMAVDGRIDVTVEAETAKEAFEKAKDAFTEADLSRMETVDSRPVNAYDNDAKVYTDYE